MSDSNSLQATDNSAKLDPEHIEFIKRKVVQCLISAVIIQKMLQDVESAIEFGYKPIRVTRQAVDYQISRLNTDEIKKLRKQYLNTFDDIYIASKKNRVMELWRMYQRLPQNNLSIMIRAKLLAQVKDEIGEDIDKISKALGQQSNTFNFLVMNGADADTRTALERAIEAELGNGTSAPAQSRGDKTLPETPDLLVGDSSPQDSKE